VRRTDDEVVATIARRILRGLELPIALSAVSTTIDASSGIASSGDAQSADELLRNADLAMYAAKSTGGSRFVAYEESMHASVSERLKLENALRTAWLTDDLIVLYQPIVDLASGEMRSVEALARWRGPDG